MSYFNTKLDDFEKFLNIKKVAIIGLGVSNLPMLDYLHSLNAKVSIFDKKDKENFEIDVLNKIEEYNFNLYAGKNNLDNLNGFDIIFRSPSCRPDTPEIVAEVKRGAILTSEIEMVLKLAPCKIIGVTGSDGKTTTTSLIYAILKDAGYNCFLGGNIGIPLFTEIKNMTPNDIVVLEMSSFQLMNMEISPNISVITNIAPNHLDIHKSYEEYIDSKKNIFRYQDKNGILVTNYDNEITKKISKEAKGNVIYFSSKTKLDNGVIYDDGMIKICKDGIRRHVLRQKDMKLRGVHNCENACAAIAATSSLVSVESQIKTIEEFSGVEHRLELVRNINGINWYNDSIGTSPSRTIAGLNSFDEKIVLIAGGYDKHLDYTPIAKPIVENVSKLILMGATADKIHDAVVKELTLEHKSMPIYHCNTLKETVELAYKIAEKGEIVLFSPASASFDLFKNFAERGNKFKELVNEL